jgi:hypothetical protein
VSFDKIDDTCTFVQQVDTEGRGLEVVPEDFCQLYFVFNNQYICDRIGVNNVLPLQVNV